MRQEQRTTTKSNTIASRPSPCSSPRKVATTTRADSLSTGSGHKGGHVEAAATLLAKARDPTRRVLGRETPHAEPAKPTGIADCGCQCWRAEAAHRGLE